jgi:ion channel-forming bestrophin family protein
MLLKNKIPFRYMFGSIRNEAIIVTLYVAFIAAIHFIFNLNISIPISVPMILGTVISLLLAFRANQAYDRWWEARIIWGAIVNDSRSWARQVVSFIDNPYDDKEINAFENTLINRQVAWAFALGRALRQRKNERDLGKWMSREDIEFIGRYSNTAMGILELQARDLKYALDNGWINTFQHIQMDSTLNKFSDHMGKCERIKNTVFPSTYGLYLHLSMNLFIMLLPFALIAFFGWLMIPLVTLIASCFWLIEKMSIHLQDPFENKPTDTPITTIAETIERDLRQVINQHSLSHSLERTVNTKQFYVL